MKLSRRGRNRPPCARVASSDDCSQMGSSSVPTFTELLGTLSRYFGPTFTAGRFGLPPNAGSDRTSNAPIRATS
jgi:hypothetical protein